MTYRVSYLATGNRVWAAPHFGTVERATDYMKALKRRGLTAWVDTADGQFVPVPGAKKRPDFLKDHR